MPRTLTDFLGAHMGETAWLFGKGPSLDSFDIKEAGPLRVAINDVIGQVPGCVYGFANDSVKAWADLYQPGHVLFTPTRLMRDAFLQPVCPGCEVVLYADDHDDERLAWPAKRLASEGLAIRPGTLGSAVQILAVMGVKRIVAVGIDGGGRHAERAAWRTRLRADHARDYNRIRDGFITAARILGIEVIFHGADLTNQLPNGMKTVKILEATFVRGMPVRIGEIIDLSPRDAGDLVRCGRAQFWQRPAVIAQADTQPDAGPEMPAIQTAQAPAAPETTALKRPAPRRRGLSAANAPALIAS